MQKLIVLLLGTVTVVLSGGSVYGSNAERVQDSASKLFYAGEYSRVEAAGFSLAGWSTKDKVVESAGSRAGFDISWGPSWYQRIALDAYSNRSLFPSEFGRGEEALSLSSLTALLGQDVGFIPCIRFSRTTFYGTGVVENYNPIFENETQLRPGEEFDVGLVFDTYYLTWEVGSIGRARAGKPYEGGGFSYSIGLVRLELEGVEVEWGSSGVTRGELGTLEDYGFGVRLAVRYGTKPITSSTLAYVQANGEVAATGIGGILKGGYEVGLLIQVTETGIVRPYVGGYFWPMMDWETDFSGIETDAGYSAGLQFELLW